MMRSTTQEDKRGAADDVHYTSTFDSSTFDSGPLGFGVGWQPPQDPVGKDRRVRHRGGDRRPRRRLCGLLPAHFIGHGLGGYGSVRELAVMLDTEHRRPGSAVVVTISAKKGVKGGTGSGSIIRSDGYILTNNHVVALAADGGSVSVLFSNGKTAPATITGRDPLTDVAVIKVDNQSNLHVMTLGQSSDVVVGQTVVALGAPLGLSSTVTSGIVSALDRTVAVPGEGVETALLIDALQTDASINPGNSGGALVNCSGQLIGMPSAGASVPTSSGEATGGSVGLNFAIPIDLASAEANEIIQTGHVTHAYFGLTAVPLSPDAALVHGVAEGLLITAVDPGGPSAVAGLRRVT